MTGATKTDVPRFSVEVMRTGRETAPAPAIPLRAGPVTALLVDGDLRHIRLHGVEIVNRLYGAVRDRNWDTPAPIVSDLVIEHTADTFTVSFVATCVAGEVDFTWRGRYTGSATGEIVAEFDGEARTPFSRNRIGWCVLHPMSLAGTPATAETPAGPVDGVFPNLISPWQPFQDMNGFFHETSAGSVRFRFEGDLFEMEDQRNWTDASFKTYSTPLSLPFPVTLQAGDRVWQRITMSVAPNNRAEPVAASVVAITCRPDEGQPLARLGLTLPTHGDPLSERETGLLSLLRPAHLRVNLNLTDDRWRERLERADEASRLLSAPLEVELRLGADPETLLTCFTRLTRCEPEPARVLVFPESGLTSTAEAFAAARAAAKQTGFAGPLGGGSRAWFTELNRRHADMPLAEMDVVGYTITPRVHAADDRSVMETPDAQAETVRSARAIAGGAPLAVGPVTLGPRFNPNATGPEPELPRLAVPPSVDTRQPALFTAAWTVTSLASLAAAGADSVTSFETTGWRGVLERANHPLRVKEFHSWQGMVFPVFHVLADIAEWTDARLGQMENTDPARVAALLLRRGNRARLLLANRTAEPAAVAVGNDAVSWTRSRTLDETTFYQAAVEPWAFRAGWTEFPAGSAPEITLLPYAVAILDGDYSGS